MKNKKKTRYSVLPHVRAHLMSIPARLIQQSSCPGVEGQVPSAGRFTVQRELELKDSQVDSILTCYQWMIDMLQRCAEERNEEILPQLGLEATSLPMVRSLLSLFGIAKHRLFTRSAWMAQRRARKGVVGRMQW